MSSQTHATKQLILASKPSGLPTLKDGQVLCKVEYFSNDTGLRNFIQSNVAPARLYVPTVPLGSAMRSGLIATVLESLSLRRAFGASGLAVYTGLYYAGEAKAQDTIVISAAAGATGSMVGAVQIAVKLLGARRVGLAHACVNYTSPTFETDLIAATPEEVDVYFDNVGGHVLDVMLTRVKRHGKIAVCGAVSEYNADKPMALKNWFELVSGRFTIRGIIMLDYMEKVPEILGELITAVADGRIVLDDGETVVEAKIEQQPEVWMQLFSGGNTGKLITKLIR
ncbi:hypothetical protein QTJ16_002679 [Diplocarpon rosae]|uniref:Enoyl reductase (ER) domain-containing protein n=1 Tax=Diplocarpon rosae TaxID=946125 RepID=A0AAD9T394_9HELO|nr:hypothetical protein QTJ16_002679 [Diplocarpon rosae]